MCNGRQINHLYVSLTNGRFMLDRSNEGWVGRKHKPYKTCGCRAIFVSASYTDMGLVRGVDRAVIHYDVGLGHIDPRVVEGLKVIRPYPPRWLEPKEIGSLGIGRV